MTTEVWKPAEGLEGKVEVSNLARVRTLGWYIERVSACGKPYRYFWPGRVLNPSRDGPKGQNYHVIRVGGKMYKVHRLVAAAFCPGRQPGFEVNHKDGDKGNSAAYNLEWVTRSENSLHAYRTGLKKPPFNPRSQKVRGTRLGTGEVVEFPSQVKAALAIVGNMGAQSPISKCLSGELSQAYGYRWERVA